MSKLTHCPICRAVVTTSRYDAEGQYHYLKCTRCGEMDIDARFIEDNIVGKILGSDLDTQRAIASAWLSRQPGITHLRVLQKLEELARVRPPGILDRAEMLLRLLEKDTTKAGQGININTDRFRVETWSVDSEDLTGITRILSDQGYVSIGQRTMGPTGAIPVNIVAGGWHHLDETRRGPLDSPQGFVAMCFDGSMKPTFEDAIKPAIQDGGFRPHRVDSWEYPGRIDDEIIAQIRKSRFVVADFTAHRGGVYYEAGFAHGLGLPVFFTCHKDDFDQRHFDIWQFNTIVWEDPEDLRKRLALRIEAVLGKGPLSVE